MSRRLKIIAMGATVPIVLAGMALQDGGSAMAGQQSKEFTLRITGSDQFTGTCWLSGAEGERTIKLDGNAPASQQLSGDKLRCEIEQKSAGGILQIEISTNTGNRSVSRTSGPNSRISLSLS